VSITIDYAPGGRGGYRIKLEGDRRRYEAKDLREVFMAIQHYFRKESGLDFGEAHEKLCPFCRLAEAELSQAAIRWRHEEALHGIK